VILYLPAALAKLPVNFNPGFFFRVHSGESYRIEGAESINRRE